MKRLIPLILALLLCGCAPDPVPEATAATDPVPVTVPTAPAVCIYDAGSALESATDGAVRVYPLGQTDCSSIAAMGGDFLVFSGSENTTITKYSGADLCTAATACLPGLISPADPAVRIDEDSMTYYDVRSNELVYLNEDLEAVKRLRLPEALCGEPALSSDGMMLYYCTADALRCIDLKSGLDRLLKEMYFRYQTPTALHCSDTVIACLAEDHAGNISQLFISTETGQLLCETFCDTDVRTNGSFYLAVCQDGVYPELLTGDSEQGPTLLTPHTYQSSIHPLIEVKAMVLATEMTVCNTLQLDYYDLQKGKRTASLTIPDTDAVRSFCAARDSIWFLRYDPRYHCDVLCQWDVTCSALPNEASCLSTRYSMEKPDYDGIAACRSTADRLSARYGVQILLWDDAVSVQPLGYTLIPEYQVPVLRNDLKQLEAFLSLFPAGFLETAAAGTSCGRIQISLVRSILDHTDAGGASAARSGLQYWDDNTNAYLSLSAGQQQLVRTACREIFHIIDSRVLTTCKAYDDWDTLNPKGFEYDYDYADNLSRSDTQWTSGPDQAFIDTCSMSYPREDRARIMAYAMTDGNAAYFQSETMQKKLRKLCIGIRDAFGLKNTSEVLVWEQYLKDPIQ